MLSSRALAWSTAATLALVVAEVAGGTLGHSFALLSDALHNLSDVPTLVISWVALRWAGRSADSERTYGYHRAGILAAFANAILLALVAVFLGYQAWERFANPVRVVESWMIATSIAALAVNGAITLTLVRGRHDLNLRSVLIHNFGDAISNIAILLGALLIHVTGAEWLDPALGLGIGFLVLWSSIGILKESAHILLEGRPRGMEVEKVARAILAVAGVQEIHDVHIWTLGTDLHALSCHVRIPDMHMDESEKILAAIREKLAHDFHISHTTIQFERAGLPRSSGYVMPEPIRSEK
ncbi:MAG TPA: cation diffusion facilitator family transporter [Candidatus Dormibacteraeota bacterium]|nr:cation diffusion facilitator family transporter [Candidatus Dormibacteraeota bacterium]